jgi:flagellar assembly factor FliW
MVIQTSRFGPVMFETDDILNFPEGLLGFSDLRQFVLVDDPADEIFIWLQSCETPNIAFPVLEPELFAASYKIGLTKTDTENLKLLPTEKTKYLCVITIPDDPTMMSANMKAPIIINLDKKICRQCVLQDNSLAIREPIFAKLQQRVVQNPTMTIKDQLQDSEVIVRIKKDQGTDKGI